MTSSEESKQELLETDTAPFHIKAPGFNLSVNYYKEYWRIYLENEQLLSKLQEIQNEVLEFQRKINTIQVLFQFIVGLL